MSDDALKNATSCQDIRRFSLCFRYGFIGVREDRRSGTPTSIRQGERIYRLDDRPVLKARARLCA